MMKKILLTFVVLMLFSSAARANDVVNPEDLKLKSPLYLNFFYQNPDPANAPQMLEEFVSSNFYQSKRAYENNSVGITAFMFGRIGKLYPDVKSGYRQVFEKTNEYGRFFILHVFERCANEEDIRYLEAKVKENKSKKEKEVFNQLFSSGIPKDVDLATQDIKESGDLDFYWAEFLLRAIWKL